MRTIDRATAFKRDYKREAKGQHRATLDNDLKPVLVALATDQPLDAKYRDHDLSGDWAGYRECHVKPDTPTVSVHYFPFSETTPHRSPPSTHGINAVALSFPTHRRTAFQA